MEKNNTILNMYTPEKMEFRVIKEKNKVEISFYDETGYLGKIKLKDS